MLVSNLLTVLMHGGSDAVVAVLTLGVVLLLLDRRRLTAEVSKKDARIDRLIDDYQHGNLTLSEALMSLKLVLFEIKAKL